MSISSKIIIVLPVLNEIENIRPLLDGIRQHLGDRDYTICLVDDGSRDGTPEFIRDAMTRPGHRLHLIERRKTHHGSQRGSALFAAMRWGLCEGGGSIFVEMDGDLSHRPEELASGLALIEKGSADVVIASKYLPGSKVTNRPIGRRLVSIICNLSVRATISPRVTDYSNGYRFYTRDAAALVGQAKIRYGSPIYLTEVMAIWISHGMRIAEFPTHYVGRNEGLSKLRVIDLVKASIGVVEIAYRLHFGRL